MGEIQKKGAKGQRHRGTKQIGKDAEGVLGWAGGLEAPPQDTGKGALEVKIKERGKGTE